MLLYFLGQPVWTKGPCDDGWVWAEWTQTNGKRRGAWHWVMQLHSTPWGLS